jgi:hypothetical protein
MSGGEGVREREIDRDETLRRKSSQRRDPEIDRDETLRRRR